MSCRCNVEIKIVSPLIKTQARNKIKTKNNKLGDIPFELDWPIREILSSTVCDSRCDLSNIAAFPSSEKYAFVRLSQIYLHGGKGFVIPTKALVKMGITKIFCYNNKMFSSINKPFGCCSKIFGCSNKRIRLLSLILLPLQYHFFPCNVALARRRGESSLWARA